FQLVARVKQKLIYISEAGLGRNARVSRAHAKRVHPPDLRVTLHDKDTDRDDANRESPLDGETAPHSWRSFAFAAVRPAGSIVDAAMFGGSVCCRFLAKKRASGISRSSPTMATTTTITTTLGSSKFCPPTTRAAAMLRCALPRAITPFVPGP